MNDAFTKREYMNDIFRFIEGNISADFDTENLSKEPFCQGVFSRMFIFGKIMADAFWGRKNFD